MSINKINLFVGFFLLGGISIIEAQPDVVIHQAAQSVQADALGNYYLIHDAQLFKYNAEGKLMYRYSNAMSGDIERVDVSNPLRILLFFKETNQLVFLNQQLAMVSEFINIHIINSQEATLACYSGAGMYWLYLHALQQIVRYNNVNQSELQTQNLGVLLNSENPIGLIEADQHLYLFTPQRVLIFDVFGNYLATIHTQNATNGFFYPPSYWGYFNGSLHLVSLESKGETTVEIPSTIKPLSASLWDQKMLLIFDNRVEIVSIP
ncbi:MAG: hypothetical protein M0P66_08600 [Salinivirgaceae bacterium]|nr:hypothetical protein [Salinivirgaceae bacterium]